MSGSGIDERVGCFIKVLQFVAGVLLVVVFLFFLAGICALKKDSERLDRSYVVVEYLDGTINTFPHATIVEIDDAGYKVCASSATVLVPKKDVSRIYDVDMLYTVDGKQNPAAK